MKNIERARQRREEEENRYRQQPHQPRHDSDARDAGGYRDNYRYKDAERSPGLRGQQRGFDERFDSRFAEDGGYKRKDEFRGRYDRDEGWESSERGKFNDREMSPAVGSYQRHDSELSATESLEIDRKQVKTRSKEILFEH